MAHGRYSAMNVFSKDLENKKITVVPELNTILREMQKAFVEELNWKIGFNSDRVSRVEGQLGVLHVLLDDLTYNKKYVLLRAGVNPYSEDEGDKLIVKFQDFIKDLKVQVDNCVHNKVIKSKQAEKIAYSKFSIMFGSVNAYLSSTFYPHIRKGYCKMFESMDVANGYANQLKKDIDGLVAILQKYCNSSKKYMRCDYGFYSLGRRAVTSRIAEWLASLKSRVIVRKMKSNENKFMIAFKCS